MGLRVKTLAIFVGVYFHLLLSRAAADAQETGRHSLLSQLEFLQCSAIGSMVQGDTQAPDKKKKMASCCDVLEGLTMERFNIGNRKIII